MGLIKAALGSTGGVLADQWKEYFYCDSMAANVLVTKGKKRTSSRNSNTKGSDNIISNGSVVAVNEGQCMMIVEQGKIVEFAAEAGEYTWNSSSEPTIFQGGLEGLEGSWETLKRRFAFGGDTAKDQRVYFFNLKELVGNKYGTPAPIPFRVVDNNIGLDMDVSIRCNGEYSYKIADPMLFYKNVCGNVSQDYTRDQLDSQLKSEFLTALQPAFARISEMGIRYSSLPGHTAELAEALNQELSEKWSKLRGIEIVSLGVSGVKASEEDEQMIKELQRSAAFMDPTRAAAHMVGAQQPAPAPAAPAAGSWSCSCGQTGNTGKFCTACGKPRPEAGWVCSCGTHNTGKFCSECGRPRPAAKCPNCGWTPADPTDPPKFCPECGKPFGA